MQPAEKHANSMRPGKAGLLDSGFSTFIQAGIASNVGLPEHDINRYIGYPCVDRVQDCRKYRTMGILRMAEC